MRGKVCTTSTVTRLLVMSACGGPADGGGTEAADSADVESSADVEVVVEGTAGGGDWSVVAYDEDDTSGDEQTSRCLRLEPQIERGPFFCESEGVIGNYGRLVLRFPRFRDHLVFTGVFAPEVDRVRLGDELVDLTRWGEDDLGVAVVMEEAPDEDEGTYTSTVDLLDESGVVLSRQGVERTFG